MSNVRAKFIVTKEYRRLAEFCDACRRYGYIGLCYGSPGVGKTLSARYYAGWDIVIDYLSNPHASEKRLAQVAGSQTVFYTPEVVNSPGRIAEGIWRLRQGLYSILIAAFDQEERILLATTSPSKRTQRYQLLRDFGVYGRISKALIRAQLTSQELSEIYRRKRTEAIDPTTLVIVDETDRLKTAGLEQVRDIFDQGDIGVVLIGMPGLEKRLSRYPQLYSRVGFVHEFRPLSAAEVRDVFQQHWFPSGVSLPHKGLDDEEVRVTIVRITGGNFRLLQRLMTQTARLIEINALSEVTREVVEAARETLVIGTA
jgi:DNA transposition AAA+ family ATPase